MARFVIDEDDGDEQISGGGVRRGGRRLREFQIRTNGRGNDGGGGH